MSADIIRSHFRNGELVLARQAARNALETATESECGELYTLLSRALCRLGEPREALRAAESASRTAHGWEARLALGEAWLAQGEPFRARALLMDALESVRVEIPDASARAVAEIGLGCGLAHATRAAGDPETGIAVASRAAAWAEQSFGSTSFEASEALFALGLCQHGAGQEQRANETLRRSLGIRTALAPEHPDVAATKDALGIVARARNRPGEAVKLHRDALQLWLKIDPCAGTVGGCRHALAQALHRTGDFEGARREMASALVITSRAFGPDHVDTQIARFELGRFEMDCGMVEEGLRAMEAARATVALHLGAEHPVVTAMDRWL